MFTKKIQCQLMDSVITPPASRPMEPPAEATNEKTPIAFAWSLGSGNIVTIMPRITAEVIAPPTPWTKRAPTRISWLSATPHSTEAAVKIARPTMNTPRREIRSPSRPANSSSPPNAIRYALTTQARLDCEKSRSRWIDGSATFTTVASRTIISIPVQRTISAIQRDRGVELAGVMAVSAPLVSQALPNTTSDPSEIHRLARLEFLGAWRSLVARTVRVGEVPGSNPGAPISRRRAHDREQAVQFLLGGEVVDR